MDGWIWTGVPAGQLRDEGCVGSLGFAAVSHVLSTPPRASSFEVTREPCVWCVPVPIFARDLDVFGHKAQSTLQTTGAETAPAVLALMGAWTIL